MGWIVSDWQRLATCARPASPTCSLRRWAIRPARHKERRNEYANERHTRVSPRIAGPRARGHPGESADVLVAATRIVGEPLDLHRAASPHFSRALIWGCG